MDVLNRLRIGVASEHDLHHLVLSQEESECTEESSQQGSQQGTCLLLLGVVPLSLDLSEGDGGHVGVGEEEDIREFLNTLVELVLQLLLVVRRVLLRLRQRDDFTSLRASHLCLGVFVLLY